MTDLTERLKERLAGRAPRRGPAELRAAAVLIPILVGGRDESILLTRRSTKLRRQPGDISFPGGAIDPDDVSPLDAALRESCEEVGLSPTDVTVLGQMDERGTVTGFRITPFVASVAIPYAFRTNDEVDALIEVPIAALREPSVLSVEQRTFPDGTLRDVYHYQYKEHDIWGITGRLIKELLELAF